MFRPAMLKTKHVSRARRYRERREKLARHLMSGELVEDHFDLNNWLGGGSANEFTRAMREGRLGCGTVACIAGHAPVVFPRSWVFAKGSHSYPKLRRGSENYIAQGFSRFFGMKHSVAISLCYPHGPAWGGIRRPTARQAGEKLLSLNTEPLPSWAAP